MAYITLRNGAKIATQSISFDATIDSLIEMISTNKDGMCSLALMAIGELGQFGVDALPTLEEKKLLVNDPYVNGLVKETIQKVSPPQKKEMKKKKEEIIDVEIKTGSLEAETQIFKKCNFCEKETLVLKDVYLDKLCQPGKFYCRFCLRHYYNSKDSRNILMMSVRSVFGYYFWQHYYSPARPHMWLSEIKDYINLHENIGLRNPLFNYDPETYNWFIDFRRIGDSKKKLPLIEVKKTLVEMLSVFNLHIHVKGLSMSAFYQKYSDAIDEFYQKRYRPEGKKVLVPTFRQCGNPEWGNFNYSNQIVSPTHNGNKVNIEDTRHFSPNLLVENLWNKTANL